MTDGTGNGAPAVSDDLAEYIDDGGDDGDDFGIASDIHNPLVLITTPYPVDAACHESHRSGAQPTARHSPRPRHARHRSHCPNGSVCETPLHVCAMLRVWYVPGVRCWPGIRDWPGLRVVC